MDVTFWGVRGSIPSPLPPAEVTEKLADVLVGASGRTFASREDALLYLNGLPALDRSTAGGNTACVEVAHGEHRLILDAGSGIRALGSRMMSESFGQGRGTGHILISHTHWDHINGFPFFVPLYVPGNRFHVYGGHEALEERFRNQHDPRNFPVDFDTLAADLVFHRLSPDEPADIDGFRVVPFGLEHPGGSFGYRIEREGKVCVYATDGSYNDLSEAAMAGYYEAYRDADALVFDAHFDLIESFEKSTWGHASSFVGVDIAVKAGVSRLVLFHHDHVSDDARLRQLFRKTTDYLHHVDPDPACRLVLAVEGLTLSL